MTAALAIPTIARPANEGRAVRLSLLAATLLIGTAALNGIDPSLLNREVRAATSLDLPSAEQTELLRATRGPLAVAKAEGLEAEQINASLPFSSAPIQPASPFSLASAGEGDRSRAEQCLTQAIYYEAGFEPVDGRRAVAQVILNRLRHPAFPKSVCGVVYEGSTAPGCQFSFTCDGSLRRPPSARAWEEAAQIAREALAGKVAASVGQATHYHTDYVAPYWAPKLAKITQIGAHIFYRWPGGWGLKGAFTGRYAGGERGVVAPAATEDAGPAQFVQAPDERRAPNDVGGRLDVSKGWTLAIPDPTESRGALAQAMAAQQKSEFASGGAAEAGKALLQ